MPKDCAREQELVAAVAAIRAANAVDPTTISWEGESRPLAQLQGDRCAWWVRELDADASEALLLAAHAHHLRRWAVPRSDYPAGRAGYLRWRADAKKRHAAEVGELLRDAGQDPATVLRVQDLVQKKGLGADAETQTLEDAICITFFETQLISTAEKLDDHDKTVKVLARTLAKMSPAGRTLLAAHPVAAENAELLALAEAAP